MKQRILAFTLLLTFGFGCAHLNQTEHEHKVSHGIVARESRAVRVIPEALDADSVKRGEVLYQQNCQGCHGAMGEGGTSLNGKVLIPDLRKTVREVDNFTFYLNISQWQRSMPGWKKSYSASEREDIAAYLKTFR